MMAGTIFRKAGQFDNYGGFRRCRGVPKVPIIESRQRDGRKLCVDPPQGHLSAGIRVRDLWIDGAGVEMQ